MSGNLVRFLKDDMLGLWEAGQMAEDLGRESPLVPVWNFRMIGSDELISLTWPYERGIVERVEDESD